MALSRDELLKQEAQMAAKLKAIRSKLAEVVLDRTSPGMEQLFAAIEFVTKENKCKVFDVLTSVSRIKKTGAKIEPPTRNKNKDTTPVSTEQPKTAPKPKGSTSKAKQVSKKN